MDCTADADSEVLAGASKMAAKKQNQNKKNKIQAKDFINAKSKQKRKKLS
jgi:hypothetical protein